MSMEELQEHSPKGPSAGERWMFCPGSVPVTIDIPDTPTVYSMEGTFAHYVTELARNEGKEAKAYAGLVSEDGQFKVDKEMVDAVQEYIDFCFEFEGETFVEQRVYYTDWVDNGFGTADHIAIDEDTKTCAIIDFKYGAGIKVNAKGNIQQKLYALGVLHDYGALYQIDNFILGISQPRIEHHKDLWEISADKLLEWADSVVKPAADRVDEATELYESFDGTDDEFQEQHSEFFKAGAWCQWCRIKGECSTRTNMIRENVLLGIDDLDDEDEPAEARVRSAKGMSDEALGKAAALVSQVKAWCTDVMTTVEKRVMAGHDIPSGVDEDGEPEFFKMVAGRSSRSWKNPKKAEEALKRSARLKADVVAPRQLISPPQAEKLIGKDHKIMQTHVKKSQGKPTLVPGSDSRDPFSLAADELDDLDIEDVNSDDDDADWDS